ncbi:alpha/beta hydrolase [Pontixanthobacter aestiaquae]|uniref:Palmitoyl-protein thioesterase ABHD10, mitochondrial n=1 Tax=Pontixanthobacter aestiaquae TaxID=1509367 RepID=A0A844Z3E1_9SPHN|nr:alpha/beta hydrolase [Pontixanthobacter aestiaquae]MDN3646770.1 alpha/beta hydrolase [Pontixanthobacter aestiaquae]MXO82248.1 alpha/beta fold hydrolase [Pontixanthobacter aestiaquae]
MTCVQFFQMPDGEQIAFRHHGQINDKPTLVFLPGYMSDMDGGKATALLEWAEQQSAGCLLLDYSGCGQSGGDFADGTLSKWRDEVLALIEARGIDQVVLIGSSMGGWLMLMIALALGPRLVGMAGIAPAPDFTEWGRSEADRTKLEAGETVFDENPYGPEPTPMHAEFWKDGQTNRLLGNEIAIDCPVRLLHGERDTDVPHRISLELAKQLRSDDVQVTLIKDGDHRLSRGSDITLLLSQVQNLLV